MRTRIVIGGLAGLTATVIWVIGMAVFQPPVELNAYAENNSYWARDLRHAAMFLALASLVLIAEGRIVSSLAGAGMVVAWIAADVFFDRADVGLFAAGLVGVVIFVGYAILAWYLTQLGIVRPDNRHSMFFWAVVCVVPAAALTATLQTPAEILPDDLAIASAATAGLLLITACTLAAEAAGGVRFGRLIAVATVLCLVTGAVVYGRTVYGEPSSFPAYVMLIFGPMVLALLGLIWLSGRTPKTGPAMIALAVMVFLVTPVLVVIGFMGTLLLSLVAGPPLTALAGSPPVNAADQEYLLTLGSVGTALVIAVILGVFSSQRFLAPAPMQLDDDRVRVS